ncbi:N-acetylmuramidase domain-containing protein, partial [Azorhizobium caulinodans]
MLSDDIVSSARAVARDTGIDEAGFLAVVEIESGGKPFESDGRTPCLLFERHVFHRELKARVPGKLAAAVKAGLALPKWSPKTQYKDQGKSADRLALLGQARAIDADCANRSCSWGLGQTMGFLAEELGYASATQMLEQMTAGGVLAQLRMMAAEITRKKLDAKLKARDWAGFARGYNGAGYGANAYDTKLAAACRRWERTLAAPPAPQKHYRALAEFEVRAIQQRLVDLGYPEVGNVDGSFGTKTIGAISAFQAHEGLPVTGDYDDATRD